MLLTGGMAVDWFRDALGESEIRRAREAGHDPYDLLPELAAEVAPGCESGR